MGRSTTCDGESGWDAEERSMAMYSSTMSAGGPPKTGKFVPRARALTALRFSALREPFTAPASHSYCIAA